MTVSFAVDDPWNYATRKVEYARWDFPPVLSVPTAAGYEVKVYCDDEDEPYGVTTLMEVSCPGLESDTDVCVHRIADFRGLKSREAL